MAAQAAVHYAACKKLLEWELVPYVFKNHLEKSVVPMNQHSSFS